MEKITSLENEKIKFLKKLGDKKFRDQSGQFLVENLIIIHDALQSGFLPTTLFVTEEFLQSGEEKLNSIIKKFPDYFIINEKVNKSFSSLATASGIAAIFNKPKKELNLGEIIIYLNAVSDPGNLGTILRTAAAFDLENIVVDEKCADIYSPKTISAAKDAIFKLNITHDSGMQIFNKIKTAMPIYATDLEGEEDAKDILKAEDFCLVLGNEANGVDESIIKIADQLIKIEMGEKIESLNVAVAAGILFKKIFDTRK
jgi:TrmH family RNA methyltransferase